MGPASWTPPGLCRDWRNGKYKREDGAETRDDAALRFVSARATSARMGMGGTPATDRRKGTAHGLHGLGLPATHPMALSTPCGAPPPGVRCA